MITDVSLTSNKALVESFVEEVFDKHNISAVEKYLGESQAFKGFLSNFFNAFPDWHANIEHMIAEDDYVMVFLNGTGTHLGEYQGKPATNNTVNIRSADLYRIDNNKIIGHWDVVDQQNLVQQTGFQL
jgi:steroid delta-isomerase-like uncharacterized protein